MNCSEFLEQVGAWALGALSPEEEAEMEAHLAENRDHQGCQPELARAQRTAAALSGTVPPARPGDRVWPAIEGRLDASRPSSQPRRRGREVGAWVLAASFATALFVTNHEREKQAERADRADHLLAEARGGLDERDHCLKELKSMTEGSALKNDAIALLEKPATRVVALAPIEGKTYRASAIVNLTEKRVIVLASSMPHVADKDFELWVIRGKEPPSAAGFLHAAGEGIEVGEIDPALLGGPEPDAFAVSLEPLGGRPTPTEVLMVGLL